MGALRLAIGMVSGAVIFDLVCFANKGCADTRASAGNALTLVAFAAGFCTGFGCPSGGWALYRSMRVPTPYWSMDGAQANMASSSALGLLRELRC